MLYETCARAEEILTLDIGDLLMADKRGRVISKGGATEWVHWQSGTAQLLPRLLRGRARGPVFLPDRKAPAGTPTLDVCPVTAGAGCPTAAPPNCSRQPPGRWPTPTSPTSKTWGCAAAGPCTSSATPH
jgi:hypothetical protein